MIAGPGPARGPVPDPALQGGQGLGPGLGLVTGDPILVPVLVHGLDLVLGKPYFSIILHSLSNLSMFDKVSEGFLAGEDVLELINVPSIIV